MFDFGNLSYCGGLNTAVLPSNVVSMATTPDGGGYWLLLADGSVYAFGNAKWYGDLRGSAWQWRAGAARSSGGRHRRDPRRQRATSSWRPTALSTRSVMRNTTALEVASLPMAPSSAIAVDPLTGGYWLATSKGCGLRRRCPGLRLCGRAQTAVADRRHSGQARRSRLLARRSER